MREKQEFHLAGREMEIVRLAARGFTDKAIALQLGISEATVGTYWSRVRAKLGPYNRTKLVFLLVKSRWEEDVQVAQEQRRRLQERLDRIGAPLYTSPRGKSEDFHTILFELPLALVLSDEGETIAFVNRAAEEVTGYVAQELHGQPLELLFESLGKKRSGNGKEQAPSGEHCNSFLRMKNGSHIFVETSSKQISTSGGVLLCHLFAEIAQPQPSRSAFRESRKVSSSPKAASRSVSRFRH